MMENIFYMNNLNNIGGTETFFYYIAKKYQSKDITFIVRTGNREQINRLKKYAKVIIWNGKDRYQCNKLFINYSTDILDYIEADEYIQVLHTDYKEQKKNLAMVFHAHPKITKYLGVSKTVCEHFTEITGLPCELYYNPIEIDKPKKVLKLISATRLSLEKGKENMIKLAEEFDKNQIPFLWLIFTNDSSWFNSPNIIHMKPRLDISNYIKEADYLVQLSKNGERFWL